MEINNKGSLKIALVRGAFMARYESQLYFPLLKKHEIVGFSSLNPLHSNYPYKLIKLPSPMDLNFGQLQRFKMPILNRLFVDAHLLIGLENKLQGFDIAHCADTFYNFTHQCVIAKRKGKVKKVVATVFENIPFNNEGIWGRKRFKTEAINEIDHFVAISNRSKATLILEGCDEGKISVIGQRIDTDTFRPSNKDNNSNNLTILFSGRTEFYKGVYEVVFSAKRLIDDPDLKKYKLNFVMVGGGSEMPSIRQLICRLNIDRNFNFKQVAYEKMPDEYRKADIFLAPSRATRTYQEQFSTVLLEAQASGLPIVTTGSGGIPENVEDAALIAYPGDFYTITELLKRFILSPKLRHEYSKRALKHIEKYSVKVGAKEVEDVYYNVLSK